MLVFRQRFGKTIVANKPAAINRPPTEKQRAVQHRFQQAVLYAKAVMADQNTLPPATKLPPKESKAAVFL